MGDVLQLPAAWRGDELLAREDWLYSITTSDQAEIDTALTCSRHLSLDAISPETFPLPSLGERLTNIGKHLETESGTAMVRGLDVSHYSENDAKIVFTGIARHIGTPVSQSAEGEIVFSVRDEGYGTSDPRVRGPNTRKKLSFHTDRCDVIAFLCLKQARSGGENEIVSSVTLYNEILRRRPDLLEVLKKPFLYKRHNVDQGNTLAFCKQPVFSFCNGHFACAFLRVLIERAYADPQTPDMTQQQREALDFLETVAAEPKLHVRFRQESGDMLFLNNWVTLHRRTAFEDWPDSEKRRHILRIWLAVPNSRPLDPLFKDNYGAVEAGAIRGGMQAIT